jgi:hypothetical protein
MREITGKQASEGLLQTTTKGKQLIAAGDGNAIHLWDATPFAQAADK